MKVEAKIIFSDSTSEEKLLEGGVSPEELKGLYEDGLRTLLEGLASYSDTEMSICVSVVDNTKGD